MSPKKSLSQNFLLDKNICNKIISQTSIKNKIVIEIGPGNGSLTDVILLQKPKKLYLIEKDDILSRKLTKKYKNYNNIRIYNLDILDFDLSIFRDIIIISNLPYNVSTKIILYLFFYHNIISEMILMLQKEVAIKFDYNKPKMNKYKLYTKVTSKFKKCFDVSPKVFFPKPKVNSSVVKFKFKKHENDFINLDKFTKIIFKNMRKKIRNKINFNINNKNILNKRVDQLTIDELLNIYYFF
tara:strand:- start:1211 stop:1930 length:720 start_codon:yes stop_codon:yes gene_type:complete